MIALLVLCLSIGSCFFQKEQVSNKGIFTSYRDVPGLTSEEIAAIKLLKEEFNKNGGKELIYGMMLSPEAFRGADGEIKGYAALMCEWLTELFDIPFRPELYDWNILLSGLETGEISFTGELTLTQERFNNYFMTSAITSRPFKYFRLTDSMPLADISLFRPLRFAFFRGAATEQIVSPYLKKEFEVLFADSFSDVYNLLVSGAADAFIGENTAEAAFDYFGRITASDFSPLLYTPVSMSALDPKFEPVITIVQKVLHSGGARHFAEMYNAGYQEYLKHKFLLQLTEEEFDFVRSSSAVRVAVEASNYPISFYNERDGKWHGIAIDVLHELEKLTGLHFVYVSDENANWAELLKMLESGEASMLTELLRSTEREGKFLWPDISFMETHFALISNYDYPNVTLNEIIYTRVGLIKGYAHTDSFMQWFPDHFFIAEYDSNLAAFNALERGEIDMVMASSHDLLILTHFLERTGYKINFLFDVSYNSTFGFNKNEVILHSIINKAMYLVNIDFFSNYWMKRTYDYRSKVTEARVPWIIGAAILLSFVLILLVVLFFRSQRIGKELEELVSKRTFELKLQTSKLLTLFDSIPDPIFMKDLNLHFIQCNKSFLQHFGRTMDDIIGKDDFDGLGLSMEAAEETKEWDRKVIEEGRIIISEGYSPRADGTVPLVETVKTPLFLEGNVVGVLGIARDITKHKEMEQKITSSYEYSKKLNNALANITKSPTISAGILKAAAGVIAQEGCYVLNANCVGIWTYNENENSLESISYYDARSGENTIQSNYDLSSRNEYLKLLKSERLIVMNNKEDCRLISDAFSGYYDNLCAALDAPIRVDGKMVGVVCVEQRTCETYPEMREWAQEEQNFTSSLADLMALAISGAERHKAREAAEMASQTKSTFLANMSHEIRTPMNAILGVTEILIQYETLPAEIEEGLEKIYTSCDLLLGIINDILDFSKIEAGKLDIMPAKYKVASLINDSVHLNMMRIDSKPIEFELQIDENIPAKLIGDELRIKQVLNNLLSNAFKYTESGKVILSVSSEAIPMLSYLPDHTMKDQVHWQGHDNRGTTLVLSVEDTGIGMTKEQLDRMFDEYSRFNEEKNITVEGTGLGLAITQRLINLMDGVMNVKSEPNAGSQFVVRLPQEVVDDDILGKDVAANLKQFRMNYMTQKKRGRQIVRDPMPYGSVLIVDDVETNLYVAVGLMNLYRLQIETAMSGQEAINKIKDGKRYDIIFMDHMMPEMDGITATKIIRDFGYNEPVIALTANAVAGQADMFLQNGFDEFISKPIDIRQLNFVLNKLVRDKQPAHVIEAARQQSAVSSVSSNADNGSFPVDSLLLESFLRDAHKAIIILEDVYRFISEGNEEALYKYTVIIHGIKSSLWNIGEDNLAEQALNLEKNARDKKISILTSATPLFLEKLNVLLKKLDEKNEEINSKTASEDEDKGSLIEKLNIIKELSEEYDRKGVLEIISEIKICSKETKAVLNNINEFVTHSEFEEAQNAAVVYIGVLTKELS